MRLWYPAFTLIIFLLAYPREALFAQQPTTRTNPVFGVIHSDTPPAVIENTMKVLLNRRMVARNPTGYGNSSKTLAGSLTLVIQSTGTTCGYSNGSFNVTASGGTAPYQYSENGYPPQSDGFFAAKAPGTYNITVKDANGLTSTATVVLTNTYPQPDPVIIDYYVNATGCSSTDASVTVSATGGTPPYQFSIDDIHFQSSNVFSNLIPGGYSFFVRDANGCENVKYFPLYRNCNIGFGYSYVSSICHPGDGAIDIQGVGGGTPPYTYSDDGVHYQSSGSFSGYSIGIHYIYIKDATGNIVSYAFPIYQYCPIEVAAIATPPTCGQQDGMITASGSNGQAPYEYSLDGIHFQVSNIFTGVAAGNYTITVKDLNGLQATTAIAVPSGCPSVTVTTINDVCASGKGSAQATGVGGTQPYLFSIDGVNFQTSNNFSGLTAANYTITIKDKNNFTATAAFNISSSCPAVTAVATDATCGYANGLITATGKDGQPPYQYSIDDINFQSSGVFPDLSAATYIIYVKDATGGESQTTVVLSNDAGPTIGVATSPASCNDDDGSLTISASGGSAPLMYSIDNVAYQPGPLFSSLKSGPYTVEVKDANGCPASQAVTVSVVNTVTVDAGPDLPVCQGQAIQLKGQSNATNISWTPAVHLNDPLVIDPIASPAETTKYYLTGSTGVCSRIDSMIVNVEQAPFAMTEGDTAVCIGKSVQIHASGGVGYSWTPVQYLDNPQSPDPVVVSPATSMLYHLVVTDGNNCKSLNDATVEVTVTSQAKVYIGRDTSIAVGEPLQLHAVDVNNSNFNSYIWSPAFGLDNAYTQDPIAVLDQNITYTLDATAPGGCKAQAQIHVSVYKGPDIYVPNAFSPNGDGHNDLLKAFPIGIASFRYFIVFNRWGQQVFLTADSGTGWDGRFKGNLQPPDTYIWTAEGTDYQGKIIQRKGSVILIR